MAWYQTDKNTCIFPLEKCASQSIRAALQWQVMCEEITTEQALQLPVRVVFLRDPQERIESMFSMLYSIALDNNSQNIVPDGIVTAYGARFRGLAVHNQHAFNKKMEGKYIAAIDAAKKPGDSFDELADRLDQLDYERFVDYVLDPNVPDNSHWGEQLEQVKHIAGDIEIVIPSHIYRMENVNRVWGNHFLGKIPTINAHTRIKVNEYRQHSLDSKYVCDIVAWRVAECL